MKLRLNWTPLILLILIAPSLSSAQSVVKKIGGEEKIVISRAEGEKINAAFDSVSNLVTLREARIDSLIRANIKTRDSLRIDLLTLKDTLTIRNKISNDTLNDYRNRYYKNIAIYEQYEKDMNFELKLHRLNSVLFAMLTLFLYSQIK
jgi:hypothetical protein